MIKNALYSLFLHLVIALLIYINFRVIKNEVIEVERGISVGILSLKTEAEAKKTVKKEEKIEPKKEIKKEIKKIVKKEKKIIKKEEKPKKKQEEQKEKIKPQEIKKEKIAEFKEPTKEPEIEKEVEKKEEEKIDPIKEEKEPEKDEDEAPIEEPQEKQKIYTDEKIVDDLEQINLSVREKFNIKTQLSGCFARSLKGKPATGISIIVKVNVANDGTIIFDFDKLVDAKRYEDATQKNYKTTIDNIIFALELCSPLRNLPAEKYDVWREFSIKFSQ